MRKFLMSKFWLVNLYNQSEHQKGTERNPVSRNGLVRLMVRSLAETMKVRGGSSCIQWSVEPTNCPFMVVPNSAGIE